MHIEEITLEWLDALSALCMLTTDQELKIRYWNRWLEAHTGRSGQQMIGKHLVEAYPELATRKLIQLYQDVLAGQVRVLSQRLHSYLLPMPPAISNQIFPYMQQSVRIAPLTR